MATKELKGTVDFYMKFQPVQPPCACSLKHYLVVIRELLQRLPVHIREEEEIGGRGAKSHVSLFHSNCNGIANRLTLYRAFG
jgi:hypothetical protein